MPTALFPYLSGPVAAIVVLIWVVWMQREDIKDLRGTLDAERHRADAAEEAARTSNALLQALIERSHGRRRLCGTGCPGGTGRSCAPSGITPSTGPAG